MFKDSMKKMKEIFDKMFDGTIPVTAQPIEPITIRLTDVIGDEKPEENAPKENGTDTPEEEWIWVTGYKGMDKDMQCYGGFQYELGARYDMLEGEKIEACSSGYHLCLKMKHVFGYVDLGKGNRFFEVRALVRKKDFDEYGKAKKDESCHPWMLSNIYVVNKLAAKSIEIIRELSVDEIMEHVPEAKYWSDKYKKMAIETGVNIVRGLIKVDKLTELGYSDAFANWLVNNGKYDIAKAVGSQEGLSMDMRVLFIMNMK